MSPPLLGLGLVRKLVVSGLSHQTHLQRERERDELNVRTTLPAAPALKTVKPETQKRAGNDISVCNKQGSGGEKAVMHSCKCVKDERR